MRKEIILPPSHNPRVPQPVAPFYHSMPLQVRFNDIDLLGHINNGVYLNFMDLGKAHYFKDILGKEVDWRSINLAVVNINVNFYAPSYIDSNLQVVTAIRSISKHSLMMEQRIVDSDTGEVKCLANTVMAGFDIKTATSRPIDDHWRQAIEAWEQRPLTAATTC